MAYFKYPQFFQESDHEQFDKTFEPGTPTGWSGIYKCGGRGKEVASVNGYPLPPQNHHHHTASQGRVRLRLVVTDKP
jgi:hypothetical protein